LSIETHSVQPANQLAREPLILSRSEHPISRRDIDSNALRLMYRLAAFGYKAYLVGGGVRDLLLRKRPKDFDIGTDARPSRLKRIFRNCRIIGRRFRIAHVFFPDGDIIEVSTFRRGSPETIRSAKGTILVDNQYGTPEEDARRRDITINGLFYDIESFSVIDYVGGVQDLKDRIIRTIADPDHSFGEDPVRMIRVQRHAARTGFEIEPNTLQAIYRNRHLISSSNPARLLEETLKDLRGGAALPFYRLLMETHLFDNLLPPLSEQLRQHGPDHPFWRRMGALDACAEGGRSFTTPVLLSTFLHTVLLPEEGFWTGQRSNPSDAWRYMSANWRGPARLIRVSRRDLERVAQILITYKKLVQSFEHAHLLPALRKKPYLSEALDFLELDLKSQGKPTEVILEWRRFAPPPPPAEQRYGFFFRGEEARDRGGEGDEGLPPDVAEEAGAVADAEGGLRDFGGEMVRRDAEEPLRRRRRRRHRSRRHRGGGFPEAGGSPEAGRLPEADRVPAESSAPRSASPGGSPPGRSEPPSGPSPAEGAGGPP